METYKIDLGQLGDGEAPEDYTFFKVKSIIFFDKKINISKWCKCLTELATILYESEFKDVFYNAAVNNRIPLVSTRNHWSTYHRTSKLGEDLFINVNQSANLIVTYCRKWLHVCGIGPGKVFLEYSKDASYIENRQREYQRETLRETPQVSWGNFKELTYCLADPRPETLEASYKPIVVSITFYGEEIFVQSWRHAAQIFLKFYLRGQGADKKFSIQKFLNNKTLTENDKKPYLTSSTNKDDLEIELNTMDSFAKLYGIDKKHVLIKYKCLLHDDYQADEETELIPDTIVEEPLQEDVVEPEETTPVPEVVAPAPGSSTASEVVVIHHPLTDHGVSRNLIYFGAPGTGKSHDLQEAGKAVGEDHLERVTFYPTYSYQQFVGTYKPSVDDKGSITYKFVPGPFLRLLVKALLKPSEDFLLVIEELNRANAAAVFGDVFQLLDRDVNGVSVYPISMSEDMLKYLKDAGVIDKPENARLVLPSNFYIWATMNSADQGVFPIDTAFKRRWDFKYLGIDEKEGEILDNYFQFKDGWYCWNTIRKAINEALLKAKVNEDKLLGPFFIGSEVLEDDDKFLDAFKSKVLMYLFEDAVRHNPGALFKGENGMFSYFLLCQQLDDGGLEAVFKFPIEKEEETTPEGGEASSEQSNG